MKFSYIPPAEQINQKIPPGIYNAKCLSVTDGMTGNNNPQVNLVCQVETMKLRFRLVFMTETAWKVKQVRRAFGFVDPENLLAQCDTSEFVGKSGLCLVGYSQNLTKQGDPYREIIEFFEESKRIAIELKLAQIIAGEKARKGGFELDHADDIPF